MHTKIDRPLLALFVIFIFGALLDLYGLRDGTLTIIDFFLGIATYKLLKSIF